MLTAAGRVCVWLTGSCPQADIENGMYAGDDYIDPNTLPTWRLPYVSAFLKGRYCEFSMKGANAGSAAAAGGRNNSLVTTYDGVRPQHNNYSPMKLQGSIILGTGGDNSAGARGTFFEGAMTAGFASAAAEEAIQASIIAAGYGRR